MAKKPAAKKVAPKATEMKLVKMVRDKEAWPEPHTADVHPDEVENYRPGGWVEA